MLRLVESSTQSSGGLLAFKVTIRNVEETEHVNIVAVPKGHPNNPLTTTELQTKFHDLATPAVPARQMKQIIATVMIDLKSLKKVQPLTSHLRKQ